MFIDASICLSEELRKTSMETRKRKIMEAAGKLSSSPDELFLFPYLINDEIICYAFRADNAHHESYISFAEELGLDPKETVVGSVSPVKYLELEMDAVEAGYLECLEKQEDLSSYCLDDFVQDLTIPERASNTKNKALEKKLKRAVKGSTPVCYYILNAYSDVRQQILYKLLPFLKSSRYKSLYLSDFCNRYGIQWKLLGDVCNKIKDKTVIIFLDEQVHIPPQDKALISFGPNTIFIGDILEEVLSEALESNGISVKLIQDFMYTKNEVIKAVKDQIQYYIDDDRFYMPATGWLFRKIGNCPRKYYSNHERYRFLCSIMNPGPEAYQAPHDSFINAYYMKEKVPPMELFARIPLVSEAKDTILSVLSDHYRLEEKKINTPGNRPVYTKEYCESRMNRPEIATDLPSVSMILYGPQDEAMYSTAKLYAEILHECMITAEDRFVRIKKGQVVSSNPDKTMGLLRKAFRRSRGGVLYIEWNQDGLKPLLDLMEEYRREVVVILSLPEEQQSLSAEVFPYTIHFRPFTSDEAWNYLSYLAKEDGYILGKGVKEKLQDILSNPEFGNANSLRSILERGKMNMAIRIAPSRTTLSDKTLSILKPQDFCNLT